MDVKKALGQLQPTTPTEKLLEAAVGEFKRDGKVTTVRCEACGELIEISRISDSALRVSCPCGHFHGTLRGI